MLLQISSLCMLSGVSVCSKSPKADAATLTLFTGLPFMD